MSDVVIQSRIIEKQKEYLVEEASARLPESSTPEEVALLADEVFYRYQSFLGKPLFQARQVVEGEIPFIEEYYENNKEMDRDLDILFSELNLIAEYLIDYFNYSQSEKDRILNIINSVNGAVNDLNLLTEETTANTLYFKESFFNHDLLDRSLTDEENRAMIHTKEGVLTLNRISAVNRSLDAKIRTVQGNGTLGTHGLLRKVQADSEYDNYEFVSTQLGNDNPDTILEGNPDSVLEYQMANVAEKEKQAKMNFDFEWAKGKQHDDMLRTKIVVQLRKPEDLNWINLMPYHAPGSPGSYSVHSIKTSEDGINYIGLFGEDSMTLNQEINQTPQSYLAEDIFDGSETFSNTKFTGQGVWSFPTRKAKYVEMVLEQYNSYPELLGKESFFRRKIGATSWQRIRKQEVPSNIIDQKYGVHSVNSDYEIMKKLEAIPGWIYSIGIRDLKLMSFVFDEKSEYISKPFIVNDGIKNISLYANEKIPTTYKEKVSEVNDWIQYYVSFDDVDWHRISPEHHQPSNDLFPPKILSVNDNTADLESSFRIFKENIVLKEAPTSVRVKIVMSRPLVTEAYDEEDLTFTTPIVEDYALKITTEQKEV